MSGETVTDEELQAAIKTIHRSKKYLVIPDPPRDAFSTIYASKEYIATSRIDFDRGVSNLMKKCISRVNFENDLYGLYCHVASHSCLTLQSSLDNSWTASVMPQFLLGAPVGKRQQRYPDLARLLIYDNSTTKPGEASEISSAIPSSASGIAELHTLMERVDLEAPALEVPGPELHTTPSVASHTSTERTDPSRSDVHGASFKHFADLLLDIWEVKPPPSQIVRDTVANGGAFDWESARPPLQNVIQHTKQTMEQVQAAFEANRSRSHVSVFLFLGVHYSHFIFKRPGDTNHLVREDLTIPQDQSQDTPVVTKIIRSYLKSSARYVPDILVLNEPSIKVNEQRGDPDMHISDSTTYSLSDQFLHSLSLPLEGCHHASVSKEESEEFHADLLEFVRSPFKDAISSIITEGTEGLARTTAKRLESAKSANESEFQPVPSSGTDDKSEGGRNLSMRLYKDDHDIADTPHEELLSRRGRGNPELAQISREALTLDEVAERRRMALQPRSSSTISGDQPHVPEVHNQEESVQDADDEGSGPDPLVTADVPADEGETDVDTPRRDKKKSQRGGRKGGPARAATRGGGSKGGSVSQAGKKKGSKA